MKAASGPPTKKRNSQPGKTDDPYGIGRPLHYSLRQAAYKLGISHDYLTDHSHPIYKPAAKRSRGIGIYTNIQIDIISLVMRGKLDEDQALAIWQMIEDAEIKAILDQATGKITEELRLEMLDRIEARIKELFCRISEAVAG